MKLANVILSLTLPLSALVLSSCGNQPVEHRYATGTMTGIDDRSALGHYRAGLAAQQQGKTEKAIKHFEKYTDANPLSPQAPDARFRQAELLYRSGKLMDSFDAYQSFITRYNSSPLYSKALSNQADVAIAAAGGKIRHSFFGLKSDFAPSKLERMLTQVRENAPYSAQAPRVQYTIGDMWLRKNKPNKAISAFEQMQLRYPNSNFTPEAVFMIGKTYMDLSSKGNQNRASIDAAKNAFLDLIQQYPRHKRVPEAKKRLSMLYTSNLTRNYEIAEFYRGKKQNTSAAFYYREVLREAKAGTPMHTQAQQRLAELGQ